MTIQTETQRLLNEFVATPEDKQQGVIVITGPEDPNDEDKTQVVICMEGDARFLLRVLCDAQLKLIKEYKKDIPITNAFKRGILPVLKELTYFEAVGAPNETSKHVSFWDLVGQLRKPTK